MKSSLTINEVRFWERVFFKKSTYTCQNKFFYLLKYQDDTKHSVL